MAFTPPMPGETSHAVLPSRAGLGSRVAAYFIDMMIALSVMVAAQFTMWVLLHSGLWTPVLHGGTPMELWNNLGVGERIAVLLAFVLGMGPIYFGLLESSPWQATFGKRLLKIHLTGNDGKRVSSPRSFGRWLSKFFCGLFAGHLISFALIGGSADRKALHDHIAKTLVVTGRPAQSGSVGPWRMVAAFGLQFLGIVGMYFYVFR